jgi:hypothetical protein
VSVILTSSSVSKVFALCVYLSSPLQHLVTNVFCKYDKHSLSLIILLLCKHTRGFALFVPH